MEWCLLPTRRVAALLTASRPLAVQIIIGSQLHYPGVNMGEVKEADVGKDQTAIFIAAGIYGAFVLGCGVRFGWLLKKRRS